MRTARGYNPAMPSPSKVAVFLPNPLGDAVMATPALRAMRKSWPGAGFVYVGRRAALDAMEGCPWPEEMLADASDKGLAAAWSLARRLKTRACDLAVIFPNSFRPALAAWMAGIPRRAGYVRYGRGWLLTDKLHPPRSGGRRVPVPQIQYYRALVEQAGAEWDGDAMQLFPTDRHEREAEALFSEAGIHGGPVVMLNPGAAFGTSKMWPAERYAELADALIVRRGARIIINAAPNEKPVAAAVAAAMEHAPAVSFAERDNSIGLLKSLIRRCDLLVTNDTGARHFAAAFGKALVTVFGSTDPVWARIDYQREQIVRAEAPCGPCQKKQCPNPPGERYLRCLKAVTVEQMFAAAERVLDAAREGRP